MRKFSILIPSWNNLAYLQVCVQSIERNSACSHEILVHVNEGSDGTLEWVRQKGLRYTYSDQNVGVCFALNSLRTLVTTDYMVFINDDMYLLPGWDSVFDEEISRVGNNRFFFSSTVIQPKPDVLKHLSVLVADYGSSPESFREEELLAHYQDMPCEDWLGATSPPNIVHRDIWDLVGGYSIIYSPGEASDQDFSAKLWLAGIRDFRGLAHSRCYHFMSKSVSRMKMNWGGLQFLRTYGLTLRLFRRNILHVDDPVSAPVDRYWDFLFNLLRSRLKRLSTACRDTKGLKLLDEYGKKQ
ncbi:Glycosyltransferase involved in cell wall bisynthesis [Prevotella sp. ne3005]|uniref:glycosyltransferase family 2 protein n=1 Tax=Prevotella sp. ne3005 TaxID=1761887 RepID=UPI0008BC8404|nr:glycosyltransferase family 2 protein [Prevotella sp. ne3005]SEM74820.1 Glycosyltransferase involved in cell wall bisynthesis [Prevotella sp. ne3005]